MKAGPRAMFREYASGLRFPKLFAITATLFLVDLVVPDVIPFADEILLALITALLGSLKKRGVREKQRRRPET